MAPLSNGGCSGPFGLSQLNGVNSRDRDERPRQHFNLSGRNLQWTQRHAFSTSPIVGASWGSSQIETESLDAATAASDSATQLFDAAPVLADLSTVVAMGGSEVAAIASESHLPVQYMMYFLEHIHTVSGVPWWATIVGATVALRTLIFPLSVMTMINTAKLTLARPEMELIQAKMKDDLALHEGNFKKTLEITTKSQSDMMGIYGKYNCNPLKSIAPMFVQAPTFITFFFSLQALSEVPSFQTGGFTGGGLLPDTYLDLAAVDPYFLLPCLQASIFLLTVEIGAMEGMEGNPHANTMKLAFRGLGVMLIPMTAYFTKGVLVYWVANNTFSLVQGIVLRQTAVKSFLGIPHTKHLLAKTAAAAEDAKGAHPSETSKLQALSGSALLDRRPGVKKSTNTKGERE